MAPTTSTDYLKGQQKIMIDGRYIDLVNATYMQLKNAYTWARRLGNTEGMEIIRQTMKRRGYW